MRAPAGVPGRARHITGLMARHPEYSTARAPPSSAVSRHRRRPFRRRAQVNAPFPIQEIKHT